MKELNHNYNFTDYILTTAKTKFLSLIEKTTKDNTFPHIADIESVDFLIPFNEAVEYLNVITDLFLNKYLPYQEVYKTCYNFLCKDQTLEKVIALTALYLRTTILPLYDSYSIYNYIDYFTPIFVLSAIDLIKWPFNEIETASIIVRVALNEETKNYLKKYLNIFAIHRDAGVDLANLNQEKIFASINKTYIPKLCNEITLAFFFYKNQIMKNMLTNILTLKLLVENKSDKASDKQKQIKEQAKKALHFLDILDTINQAKKEDTPESAEYLIKRKLSFNLSYLQDECTNSILFYTKTQRAKEIISLSFKRFLDDIHIEDIQTLIKFNFDYLAIHYESMIKDSYKTIIKMLTENISTKALDEEINKLAIYIIARNLSTYMKREYKKYQLTDFLQTLSKDTHSYLLVYHMKEKLQEDLGKKLLETKVEVEKKLKLIKNASTEMILTYLRERLAKDAPREIIYYSAEYINISDYDKFKDRLNELLEKTFQHYSNQALSFDGFITFLAKISNIASQKGENHLGYFLEKFKEKRTRLHDIYKAIITQEVTNKNIFANLKGMYIFHNIIDTINETLECDFYIVYTKDSIDITENVTTLTKCLIPALIMAKLIELGNRNNSRFTSNDKNLPISFNYDKLPVPTEIQEIPLDSLSKYLSFHEE